MTYTVPNLNSPVTIKITYQNFYQNIPIFKAKMSNQLDYCFQSLHIIILVQYEIEYDQFLGGLVGDCL